MNGGVTPECRVHPRLNSYITLLGKEHIESYIYFTVNDTKLLSMAEGLIDNSGIASKLSNETIAWIKANGLDQLSEILARGPKTKFEEQVLESIFIYSRCPLARDVSDKLIYILVAIESVLLKDENEAVKQRQRTHAASGGASKALPHEIGTRLI